MKQNKRIFVIVFAALLSFVQVNALGIHRNPTTVPVELKLVGSFQNQPLLQLDFSGSKEENQFIISITDETGLVLYNADVKGEVFSKQFLLNTDNLGDAVLNFAITGKRSGKTVNYRVTPQAVTTEVVKL